MKGLVAVLFVTSLLYLFQTQVIQCFYLPGVAPREYAVGEEVALKVNKMTSVHTQFPYGYYQLPFCRPNNVKDVRENLGEMLLGDKIENSIYKIYAMEAMDCVVLCQKNYTQSDISHFLEKVKQEYRVHWIVDNLPSATKKPATIDEGQYIYEAGFPLGEKKEGEDGRSYYVLNNHIQIKLLYHTESSYEGIRIVGFEVVAQSINYGAKIGAKLDKLLDTISERSNNTNICSEYIENKEEELILQIPSKSKTGETEGNKNEYFPVYWTYSVSWEPSGILWSARWDAYFKMVDSQIHWFSIINAVMVVLFLSGMIAMIMMRTLHRDIGHYKELEGSEEAQEETGWKLVHGDVFRPPRNPMLLSVFLGNGIQTLIMVIIVMVFSVLGFLSPANRGGLMTSMVLLLVFMGVFAGYFAARCYKIFKGKLWKKTTIMTAALYPGITFAIFFVLNLCLLGERSSGAVPWYICLELFALWVFVYVPLSCGGAYFGFKKPVEDPPVRVNQIPRQIPEQIWYMKPIFSILMGGILPFGAIFIELFFILSSIWMHQFYYLFGFLFIVFVILVITCAEITIVMCYFQLCAEDYHWWWRSFLTSGASSFYMFAYSVFYFFSKLQITGFVSGILYFGYTFIMTMYFFALTGAIGYYACWWFVRKIYSEIHVE